MKRPDKKAKHVGLQAMILRLKPQDILVIRTKDWLPKEAIVNLQAVIDRALEKSKIDFPIGVIYAVGDSELYLKTLSTRIEEVADPRPSPCTSDAEASQVPSTDNAPASPTPSTEQ